jgi:uracil-DNA glycosylase family 4
MNAGWDAPEDCALCPRLVQFRQINRLSQPGWFNAPVPSFGDITPRLLIVGLAPGLRGANRTGRPFTGDYAGDLLYPTLIKSGFAEGTYGAEPGDGLKLKGAMITNAVRCVPPQNKPTPAEIRTCRTYLKLQIEALTRVQVILALGTVAHQSVLAALGLKASDFSFAHGARHDLPGGRILADSYHCSRLNTSTKRLTTAMFEAVFKDIRALIDV